MFNNPLITNPAELALPYIESVNDRNQINEDEERLLAKLDRLAGLADMHTVYFAQVGRALAIPVSFEADKRVTYGSFNSLTFEGRLVSYSIIKLGRILGATPVRALCLSFDEVTLLPYFETLPEDQLLHVPALAVDSMTRSAA